MTLPLVYDGIEIDVGYRIDMLVESTVVVELKAITRVLQVHRAQVLSHLRIGGYAVGLLINFHVLRLKHGITRLVNGL
jgi:GxxExxY protein